RAAGLMLLPMHVRRAHPGDTAEWSRMRAALWPDADPAELESEIGPFLDDPDQVAFVAERDDGHLAGLVEASVRAWGDGIAEEPCAFVEGWWVDADVRRAGVGRALIAAVEHWARGRGFSELGSDTELDNVVSQRAHTALGFNEVERRVTFSKRL